MSFEDVKKAIEAKRQVRQSKEIEFEGVKVLARQISAYGIEEYREFANSEDPQVKRLYRAKMVQLCLNDIESGRRLYDDKEVRDLAGHNSLEIDRVFHLCLTLNVFDDAGREGILKNLLMTLGEDGLLELREIIDGRLQNFSKDTPATN